MFEGKAYSFVGWIQFICGFNALIEKMGVVRETELVEVNGGKKKHTHPIIISIKSIKHFFCIFAQFHCFPLCVCV